MTRRPFVGNEVDDIYNYVIRGGALLLMSNHSPFADVDAELARRFGVTVHGCYSSFGYWTGNLAKLLPELHADHSIMTGLKKGIEFNSCAYVRSDSDNAKILTCLPDREESQGVFAVAAKIEAGRYVIVGDSGFIGNAATTFPGPGYSDRADNIRFVRRSLSWLRAGSGNG